MASLNRAILIGNLTRDPELRYIPSGQAVTTFTLAVNRVYNTPGGERKEEVSFIRIVTWARQAETCAQYLKKGSPACVEGRLQSRSWETQDGQKRSTVEVVANNVQFLGARPGPGSDKPVPGMDAADTQDIRVEAVPPMGQAAPGNSSKTKEDEVPF